MKIEVRNTCAEATSYRAARVKSLFNAESGANFSLDAELPIEDMQWRIGVVVGPSGSGKTSIGRLIFPEAGESAFWSPTWPDAPLIEAIGPEQDFDDVTAALGSVGLGSVPTWLRPYGALSNGERFRADLARLVIDAPPCAVVDEFTSVVDRQIARFGALAFAKAWRRGTGQVVLLTPHYDVLEWLEPDWIYDTAKHSFARGSLRRPKFTLDVWKTDSSYWRHFEPHHYLKLPLMVGAHYYVGAVEGELACHLAVGSINKGKKVEARACRLVVMPEWQGAGVGLRFLNAICEMQAQGDPASRLAGRPTTTIFHTSHPQLCAALRRDKRWRQITATLHGVTKVAGGATIRVSQRAKSTSFGVVGASSGYGGHFRAVQGFRYYGAAGIQAAEEGRR
jgi:GNAT superfamily N-acetyltransferase